jgi:hypothetical protein
MDNLSQTSNVGYVAAAGGIVAAACGLLLLLGIASASGQAKMLLALGAIVGGAAALAGQAVAYNDASADIDLINRALGSGAAIGYGVPVGIAGGAIAVVGGLLAMRKRT